MLRVSRRGFQAGLYRPPPELDLDSLLVLSADSGRFRMMLLMLSLKSRSRLEQGLGVPRGTCCSFRVSPEIHHHKQDQEGWVHITVTDKTKNTNWANIHNQPSSPAQLISGCWSQTLISFTFLNMITVVLYCLIDCSCFNPVLLYCLPSLWYPAEDTSSVLDARLLSSNRRGRLALLFLSATPLFLSVIPIFLGVCLWAGSLSVKGPLK